MTKQALSIDDSASIEEPEELKGKRSVLLTSRDKELFVHLAMTRYLSTAQVERLLFVGKDDSIARRRLGRLAANKYLRRVPYRNSAGDPAHAWTLDDRGYFAAQRLYSAIPQVATHDVKPDFLQHDLYLNGLYVALADAAGRKKLSFDRRPFRWLPSTAARLPWREYDRASSTQEPRIIRPDAVLELPGLRRRIFIEAETGTHTLGFRNDHESRGSTRRKIERYTKFVAAPASVDVRDTFYQQAYPDHWAAELLFVVPTVARRDAILCFIAGEWRQVNEAVQLIVRAITFDEADADLCRLAGFPSPAKETPRASPSATPAPPPLTHADLRAFYDFYNWSVGAIGAVRQFARSHPVSGLPVPEHPPNHVLVKQLCERIAEALK